MTQPIRKIAFRNLSRISMFFALAGFLCLPVLGHAQDTQSADPAQNNSAPLPPQSDNGAPPRHRRGMNPQAQLKRMTKQLNLTADQQQQILPILQDRDKQMSDLRQNSSVSPQDRHSQMRSIGDTTNQKIEAILNDTQKQQYEAMQAKQRQRMQERRQQNSGAPPDSSQPNAPPASGGQSPQ